jgi:hypothetical protein
MKHLQLAIVVIIGRTPRLNMQASGEKAGNGLLPHVGLTLLHFTLELAH